jgi:hypothetical protein
LTIVTALKRSSTVSRVVISRCWAIPLRTSGGTDWLSARNMSSRSGAVYPAPVRPVRSSVVSAAVKPHSLPVVAAIPEVTASSKRARGLAETSSGGGRMSCCGTASLSAMTAVNGRGAARPARIEVATDDRIDAASSAASPQSIGGIRIWLRGAASGTRARHSTDANASCLRATAESC